MNDSPEIPREIPPSEIRYESGGAIEEIFNSISFFLAYAFHMA